MKFQIKKLLTVIPILTLSTSVLCNTSTNFTQQPKFSVNIDALYLRPTDDSTEYAFVGFQTLDSQVAFENTILDQTERAINLNSDFGFRMGLSYAIPCTNYDIMATYTQFNSTSTDSIEVPPNTSTNPGGSGVHGPFVVLEPLNQLIIGSALPLFGSAASQINYNLKVFDLDVGRHFSGCNYDFQLFGGLRYAKLNRNLDSIGFPPIPTPENTSSITSPGLQDMQSHFRGVGPHVGVKGQYGLYRGFALAADIEGALLTGPVDSYYKATVSYIPTNFTENIDIDTKHSENRTVGVFEGKLGVNYTYKLNCNYPSALVVEAGYQSSIYYNSVEEQDVSYFAQINGGVASNEQVTVPGCSGNIAFNGPYLSVKYYA